MVNYLAVDISKVDYDDFTYTNRLDFYPFYMVGYTFMGWSSDTSWTNVDQSQVALFNNCKSFVSSGSTSETYDTMGEYNFYTILKSQILNPTKITIGGKQYSNVNLYARWEAEVYTVAFNVNVDPVLGIDKGNQVVSTTSYAQFYDRNENRYSSDDQLWLVTVVFDTDVWDNMTDSLVTRYGYDWNGWYFSKEDTVNGQSSLIVKGVDRIDIINRNGTPTLNYSLYLNMVDAGALPKDEEILIDPFNPNNQTTRHLRDRADDSANETRDPESFDVTTSSTNYNYNTKLVLTGTDNVNIFENGSYTINKISVTLYEDIYRIVGTYDYDYRIYTCLCEYFLIDGN